MPCNAMRRIPSPETLQIHPVTIDYLIIVTGIITMPCSTVEQLGV